ncbi:MAG: hypothetical protein KBD37_05375 [Burkholderiales bacterium]|nr:hypothetical protein [Burkholderiales bacterium]
MFELNKNRQIILLFYLVVLFIYLLPAIMLPFNSSPDEAMRLEVVKGIVASNHILRAFDSNSDINSFWGFGYSFLISNLQYILIYIVHYFINIFYNCDVLIIGRLFAVVVGILCVYTFDKLLVALITEVRDNVLYRFSLVSVYAFWPQIAFMFTYVNADSGALLVTNLLVLNFINGWRNKWCKCEVYYLGLIIGCAVISYYNEYAVIVGILIGFFVDVIRRNLLTFKLIRKLCMSVLLLLIVCAPYILNNYLYYNDLFGLGLSKVTANIFAPYQNQPVHSQTLFNTGHSIWYLLTSWKFWFKTIASFIGWFGYMSIAYHKFIYCIVVIAFCYFSVLGINKLRFKSSVDSDLYKILGLIGVISFVIALVLFICFSYFVGYQPQGRYLFPAFLFIIFLPIYGIHQQNSERFAFFIALILLILCTYSIELQFLFYHVELSLWHATQFIMLYLCMVIILFYGYSKKIFSYIVILCLTLIGIKFLYFSYFQNFYYMQDNQFSQPIIKFQNSRSAIKIQAVNGLWISESNLILEHKMSHIFPVMLLISDAKLSKLYLSYNGRSYPNIHSVTAYDVKTATAKIAFVINDFVYPAESVFSIGSYSNGLFTIESSVAFKVH